MTCLFSMLRGPEIQHPPCCLIRRPPHHHRAPHITGIHSDPCWTPVPSMPTMPCTPGVSLPFPTSLHHLFMYLFIYVFMIYLLPPFPCSKKDPRWVRPLFPISHLAPLHGHSLHWCLPLCAHPRCSRGVIDSIPRSQAYHLCFPFLHDPPPSSC